MSNTSQQSLVTFPVATSGVPPTIKDPSRWLIRKGQRADRRPRLVNYPELRPGERAVGIREKHGKADIVITREPHPKRRSKYSAQ